MVQVIGFCSTTGPSSGKSTTAQMLKRVIKHRPVHILSFATPVKALAKELAMDLWDEDLGVLEKSDDIPETGLTVRDFYVLIGDGTRRSIPDLWVGYMHFVIEKICETSDKDPLILIDDVRYLNEFKFVVDFYGGQVFNVFTQKARPIDAGDLPPAETFSPNRTIFNPGDERLIIELSEKVLPLIK